ncbi:MAG: hypothetical protein SFU99_07420 [Saprospiraceae bacterium]|nr:hypothetical protein [Saprospiraceae bacterium]
MTLQELFNLIAENPAYVIFYFTIIPIAAFMAGALSKGEAHLTPWNVLFSVLIYAVCIPGIFAVTLDVYFFLFEKRSIMNTDVYTQILPVVSMVITLLLIRRYVDFDYIPGFDKISGLITMIAATLGIMWFIDRTKIYAITFLRFEVVLLIFLALLLLIRFGWSKIFGSSARRYQED